MIPRVAIIVLNWNGGSDTLDCLDSLAETDYPCYTVLLVDNGSTDGSLEIVRQRYPWVQVLAQPENLGYAGGNNVGLREALKRRADYVLLLNNDTTADPCMLWHLVAASEMRPDAGVSGPTIYYSGDPEVIWSAGGAVDWQAGSTSLLSHGQRDDGQLGDEPREVDFVTGCAMFIRCSTLQTVGLLDERFYAYYEDVEFCVRLRRAGPVVLHVPGARLWHRISPQAREASPLVHYYMTRNRLLFLATSAVGLSTLVRTLVHEYLRTLVSWTVRPQWRRKRLQRCAMWRAISDAACGRWGPAPAAVPHRSSATVQAASAHSAGGQG